MNKIKKHLGFLGHLGELRFKMWMNSHAHEVLTASGLEEGLKVLDFGSGLGTYTIPAAKIVGERGRVYALDLSRRALDKVEERAKRASLANIERLDPAGEGGIPLGDGNLDHVLLIDVLQEIKDNSSLITEVSRVLRPGGNVTIFPMHLNKEAIESLMISKGFALKARIYEDRILLFNKGE